MTSSSSYIILVTGGTGCLGQHVIGLLQTHAPHVTEIRVIDLKPYENKLDYTGSVPVRQFCGTITNRNLVQKACQGVSTVFHIASVVDFSMFPNVDKMEHVNVEGTSILLDVSKEAGVRHFVYCSSMAVVLGYDHINGGTEATLPYPENPMHDGYATTKQKAETMVLERNCDTLKTVSIRPVPIFGEEDVVFASDALAIAQKIGRWPLFDCKGALHQMTYAGNVAWMFICAERTLLQDKNNAVRGNAFFAADDTPLADAYEMMAPFAEACNLRINRFKLPMWLILYPMYLLYWIFWLVSSIFTLNIPISVSSLRQLLFSYNFRYEKAKTLLSYTPLYTYEESLKRSVRFYKKYTK